MSPKVISLLERLQCRLMFTAEGQDHHLHGFVFDEHEAEEITRIFDRKKSADGTITFTQLSDFLHSYWGFMQRTNNITPNTPFPQDRLNRFWSQVCGQDSETVNLEQFRYCISLV